MKRRDLLKSLALSTLIIPGLSITSRWGAAVAQDGTSIFTLAYPAGFPDLDPATSFSNDGAVLANTYESLTRYVIPADGSVAKAVPLLAESWQVSGDGLVWTFRLRSGVKFMMVPT